MQLPLIKNQTAMKYDYSLIILGKRLHCTACHETWINVLYIIILASIRVIYGNCTIKHSDIEA